MNLTNNTIFITGGGSGIGLALAEALIAMGNTVIICGRNVDKLAAAQQRLPALHTVHCDLTDQADVERTVAWLHREFGKLNILINNAGILHMDGFYQRHHEVNEADLVQIAQEIDTNLLAPMQLTKRLLPLLAEQSDAAVVNISSGLAYVPMASAPVYCATKAALHSWSRSLRHQLAATSVKVFEVLPPTVDTAMTGAMQTRKITPQAMAATTIKQMRRDVYEIRVGQSRALYVLSRIAPTFAERLLLKG